MSIRNALVTGCDFGLGLELVKVLSHDENVQTIFAGCFNPEKATELKKLAQENSKVKPIKLQLDDDESIQKAAELVESQVSDEGLDLLINNAGINEDDGWLKGQPNRDLYLKHFSVNTIGPVVLTNALLPSLRTAAKLNNKAVVLNISSDRGSIKLTLTWQSESRPSMSYGQSKAALNHFTRTLAYYETTNGITSISVHPGWIQTPMGGPNAELNASESAEKIIKLASKVTIKDTGRYVNRDGNDMDF
uniref:Uncharacterized protein n=1 Tax=Acrobeloides nanus TaxID=290746 RepID=A0A914CKP0_9BILA